MNKDDMVVTPAGDMTFLRTKTHHPTTEAATQSSCVSSKESPGYQDPTLLKCQTEVSEHCLQKVLSM